jgi:hypothetical protein
MFLSSSVVHFSGILAACLIVLAPIGSWLLFGVLILGCGMFGLAYYAIAWRDTVRTGLSASIAWDDKVWYAVLPVGGYLIEAASGVMVSMRSDLGCVVLAVSVGVLLLVGIHNAWDITVWTITRERE